MVFSKCDIFSSKNCSEHIFFSERPTPWLSTGCWLICLNYVLPNNGTDQKTAFSIHDHAWIYISTIVENINLIFERSSEDFNNKNSLLGASWVLAGWAMYNINKCCSLFVHFTVTCRTGMHEVVPYRHVYTLWVPFHILVLITYNAWCVSVSLTPVTSNTDFQFGASNHTLTFSATYRSGSLSNLSYSVYH